MACQKAQVYRITVDERLGDGLIHLAVCPLAGGIEEFFDRGGDWDKERQWRIRPENYAQKMGIPLAEREEWPWEKLAEGQVFLSGEFQVVGESVAPEYFRVSPGRSEFLRIDDLEVFKEGISRMYSELLRRSE